MTTGELTNADTPARPVGFERHDHANCISSALAAAEAEALTPLHEDNEWCISVEPDVPCEGE